MNEQIHAGEASVASGQIDLQRVGRIVRRHLWVVIATTAVVAAVAWMLAGVLDQGYAATTRVALSTAPAPGAGSDSWRLANERVDSVAELVETPVVATAIIEDLDLGWTTAEVLDRLSARALENTVIVEIEARDPDPATASAIVNAASRQLAAMVADVIDARLSVQLIGSASPPVRVSPSRALATGLGAMVGPFLGAGAALMLSRLRRRIRDVDDIPPGLCRLGRMPLRTQRVGDKVSLASHLVRMRLEAVIGRPSVITVAGAGADLGDGASSSVAAELARAYERSGRRSVIVDGSFGARTPVWPTGSAPGLSDVLDGHTTALDALTRLSDLTVLPRGVEVPEPSKLIHHVLAAGIDQLVKNGMVVIIDAPAALDGVTASLMADVSDAIVLVAEAGRTSRADLRTSVEALAGSQRHVGILVAEGKGSIPAARP